MNLSNKKLNGEIYNAVDEVMVLAPGVVKI